jgi:hypothetical protein
VRRGLVHTEEDRVVVAAEPDLELGRTGAAGALDRLDQRRVVHRGDLLDVRHRGRNHPQPLAGDPELLGQPHGEVDPDRRHRVVRAEVVLGERRVEDDRARARALHGLGRYPAVVLSNRRVQWWPA